MDIAIPLKLRCNWAPRSHDALCGSSPCDAMLQYLEATQRASFLQLALGSQHSELQQPPHAVFVTHQEPQLTRISPRTGSSDPSRSSHLRDPSPREGHKHRCQGSSRCCRHCPWRERQTPRRCRPLLHPRPCRCSGIRFKTQGAL